MDQEFLTSPPVCSSSCPSTLAAGAPTPPAAWPPLEGESSELGRTQQGREWVLPCPGHSEESPCRVGHTRTRAITLRPAPSTTVPSGSKASGQLVEKQAPAPGPTGKSCAGQGPRAAVDTQSAWGTREQGQGQEVPGEMLEPGAQGGFLGNPACSCLGPAGTC